MNQQTRDRAGVQYIFGYFIKNQGWQFAPHRFQLHHVKDNILRGQFLTSLWFSHIYHADQAQNYMILGLRGGFSYSKVTQIVNKWDWNSGRCADISLSQMAKMPSIVFWDTFRIDAKKTTNLINSHQEGELFVLDLHGHLLNCELSLRARRHHGGLYMTLPDFTKQLSA